MHLIIRCSLISSLITSSKPTWSWLDHRWDYENVFTAFLYFLFDRFHLLSESFVVLVIFVDLYNQKFDYLIKFPLHFLVLVLNGIDHHPHLIDLTIFIFKGPKVLLGFKVTFAAIPWTGWGGSRWRFFIAVFSLFYELDQLWWLNLTHFHTLNKSIKKLIILQYTTFLILKGINDITKKRPIFEEAEHFVLHIYQVSKTFNKN